MTPSFLLLLFIATFLALCGACWGSSLIIVGAGPAGIAAATRLLENGFTNFTILEAENRIGGRVHSVKFGDAYVDLGAEFCHGQKGNVIYEKASKLLDHSIADLVLPMYYSNGSRLDKEFAGELQHLARNYDLGQDNSKGDSTGLSTGELFLREVNATLMKKYSNDDDKIKVLTEGLRFAEGCSQSYDGCFSWFDLSPQTHYEECEGDQQMTWGGRGYKTALEILMKSYPNPEEKLDIDSRVKLNTTVTRIDWNKDVAEVTTSDHTIYNADHVIFTPSVGVLRDRHHNMFQPQLSTAKQQAIDEIGFDAVMKIIMHFPKQWWRDEDKVFAFIWSDEDLKEAVNKFPLGSDHNQTWISGINILASAPNNSNVRIAWVTGEALKEVEVLPIDTLKRGIALILSTFLAKDYDIVEPDQIIRSTWYNNPNFRGTYSYEKIQYYNENISKQSILADPLVNHNGRPIVLFAGEATNPIHFSTVHGAVETGYREANRLMNLFAEDNKNLSN